MIVVVDRVRILLDGLRRSGFLARLGRSFRRIHVLLKVRLSKRLVRGIFWITSDQFEDTTESHVKGFCNDFQVFV